MSDIVLVSACLAGCTCRYDGRDARDPSVAALVRDGRAVTVCPEQVGGLETPREPAELVGGHGADVLDGRARVLTVSGRDVTGAFLNGAREALAHARAVGARVAILKERSPSCGVRELKQRGNTVAGMGVTAALLMRSGIRIEAGGR